jgi:hypothetical protein
MTIDQAIAEAVRAAVAPLEVEIRALLEELAQLRAVIPVPSLLDAAEVGRITGRSAAAIRRAHERGTLGIEGVRVGKRSWRWRRGDVLALTQPSKVRRRRETAR